MRAPSRLADHEVPPESDVFEGAPHPRLAQGLIGQSGAEQGLLEAVKSGRLPHAWIFGGPEGIGKATLAWRFARFIMAHPDLDSPKVKAATSLAVDPAHPVSRRIAARSQPDIFLLKREWNIKTKKHFSEIRTDDVRKAIAMFQRAAGAGGYRICILDCAEDLNGSGANALLKLIEEPPPKSLFLIVAHRPGQILPTIRSRCRMLAMRALDESEIVPVIKSLGPPWSQMDPSQLNPAAARAHGSVRRALRLLKGNGVSLDQTLQRLFSRLPQVDWRAIHALADSVAPLGATEDFETVMSAVYDWLQAQVHAHAGQGAARLAPFAQVWEKTTLAQSEVVGLNLDRRPFILDIFAGLSGAMRQSASL